MYPSRLHPSTSHSRHGGAVIIVVLSLMALLAFLGLFFFSFASEEYNTSENFISGDETSINPDPLVNEVLQQTLVGTTNPQSVLGGNAWSILSSILGTPNNTNLKFNNVPYNGKGILVGYDSTSGAEKALFDYDANGTTDADSTNFHVYFGRAQNGGSFDTATLNLIQQNAGYTYPDINSLFLGFDGYAFDRWGTTVKRHHVVIPSYFRPQYFHSRRTTGFADLYTTAGTARQVLRPHQEHLGWNIDTDAASSTRRFLSTSTAAASGDRTRTIKPFPFVIDLDNPSSPTATEYGIFTNSTLGTNVGDRQEYDYEYDADADGDGTPDSILLDLGLPLIELSGGQQVVPLVFIKWVDGDGLLNINMAGNINDVRFNGTPFAYDQMMQQPNLLNFSTSNFGRSRGELNLAMALYANPRNTLFLNTADIADVTRQQYFMGNIPFDATPTFSPGPADVLRQPLMANLEMAALLGGRFVYQNTGTTPNKLSTDPIPGRWGDSTAQVDALVTHFQSTLSGLTATPIELGIPAPGQPGVDDDDDLSKDLARTFGHPIDSVGLGNIRGAVQTGKGYKRAFGTLGVNRFPYYQGRWADATYNDAIAGLIESVNMNGYRDESAEGFPDSDRNAYDSLFGPEEALALHGSQADLDRAKMFSRIAALAPFNLRDNLQAEFIRKQFTPRSWDRLESTVSEIFTGTYSEWRTGSTTGAAGTVATIGAESLNKVFPPMYTNPSPTGSETMDIDVFRDVSSVTNVEAGADPFRPIIRKLLAKRIDDDSTQRMDPSQWLYGGDPLLGRRLNLNKRITGFSNGLPSYQPLDAHDATPTAAVPASASEQTARVQRQQMARDLYVLLYTLGNANGAVNATSIRNTDSAGRPVYSLDQLRMMAQFAVNTVDALDSDSVITRFQYDRDLSNGWNIDDDPYSTTGDASSPDADVVYGVEAQTLTLSEALLVTCPDSGGDKGETQWNDTADRSFAYIELRNAQPSNVDLTKGNWKLKITATDSVTMTSYDREVIFKNGTVSAGGLFTVGTAGDDANPAGLPDSLMRVDLTGGTTTTTVIAPATGTLDLDLISAPVADFETRIEGGTVDPTRGVFFPPALADSLYQGNATIRLSLSRRLHLGRAIPASAAEEADNPWVEVDHMELEPGMSGVGKGFVAFDVDAAGYSILTEVEKLQSWERSQPFHRNGGERSYTVTAAGTGQVVNSLGQDNQASQTTAANGFLDNGFTLWQPHFDRDFNSVYDLLLVPVCGPADLTTQLGQGPGANAKMPGQFGTGATWQAVLAGAMFLMPEHPGNLGQSTQNRRLDNHWARILELLEVPDEDIKTVNGQIRKTPGLINLNTLRHESVLAAMIDDPTIARLPADFGNPASTDVPDYQTDSTFGDRNWFFDTMVARDGLDPIRNLPIPGGLTSAPFRALSHIKPLGTGAAPIYDESREQTILRKGGGLTATTQAQVAAVADRHRSTADVNFPGLGVLEARSATDLSGPPDEIDFAMRHRLLSKVGNHSTTRSHVFFGWIGLQYHDAHKDSGVVQVGARSDSLPTHRMFVVIDMSRLEEAYDSTTQTFDWRKFIVYRQRLE